MTQLEQILPQIPSPCYVVEESLLRRNLTLIQSVAQRAGVEIILAFKAFALWKTFPIFREYISHTTASSLSEARLAAELFGSKAHTYSPAYTDEEFEALRQKYSHAQPFTKESLLYREIFEKYYPGQAEMVVDFWMPNKSWEGCNVNDPSARVLANYGDSGV